MAAAVGVPVAPVQARSVTGRPYLLVTRYDRHFGESGKAHRLHQGTSVRRAHPERKYAAEDGPTFKTSFELLRRAATVPAVAVLALLDVAILNVIVGNADAHGKNFSLLYQRGAVTLAPFYELLSTVAYPVLAPNLAMRIAKRATLEDIGPATWPEFAEDIGLATPFVRRRVAELADAVLAQATSISDRPAFATSDVIALRYYAALIRSRAEQVALTSVARSLASGARARASQQATTPATTRKRKG